MYEVSSVADHANVILMDDDILCEPETDPAAQRLREPDARADDRRRADAVPEEHPRTARRRASRRRCTRLRAGRWAPKALHEPDMVKHRQHKRVDAEYNAWWSCLIPSEVIAAIGLPLPMFFQWDDIEYGLRAAEAGFPTVDAAQRRRLARRLPLEGPRRVHPLLQRPQLADHPRAARHDRREDDRQMAGARDHRRPRVDAIRHGVHR